MAPHLMSKREDAFGSSNSITKSPWILVAIILSALVIAMIIVFVVLYFLRKKRLAEANQQLPVIGDRLQTTGRRRKISAADRKQAEEMERSLMIRKSLASRSTFSTIGSRDSQVLHSARSSSILNHNPFETADETGDSEAKDDWKEWEVRAQTERRHSRLEELAMGGGRTQHPALSRELQDLPIPRQARVAFPSGDAKGPREKLPLPPLHSPPPPPYQGTSRRPNAINREWV
ncbi:hypothetical protein BKA67DRAFT_583651 [Truncatella angustata]|uniref:Uncharacterized protein n=1 Tax=Truncatella angustata TaxID=152316 RepID=A0A9P8RHR6_9PEZI|nr:uncharacterized protein BKA67DRAFT_583651 [Truncatella angustata]KAH6646248.1 hypothetical protein BKA67DRAFT_583651 [Truncatella angustata]KAH8203945.1 hypothetical protein TruAng_001887 [Truncatella angustata]